MKLGLFFGAGAEVGYGLPSGGKFAIDLFRQDVSQHKKNLREQLHNSVDKYSSYATDWLPERFETQRIHAFGKNEFTSLIESSIEYRKNAIIKLLNSFDEQADIALNQLGITRRKLAERFAKDVGHEYGEHLYAQAVRMNQLLAQEVLLFSSEFYSAVLDAIRANSSAADLQRYAAAFLQLLVGAHGQELVQKLNQELFTEAPDDIPIFDDISGVFRLEFNRAGLTALELLLEEQRKFRVDDNAPVSELLCALSQRILENLFSVVLDYQSLIDSHFRYLFSPKTEWAKFTKMVVFLRAARDYIEDLRSQAGDLPSDGYYHDLQKCHDAGIEITAIGTANYNNLVENITSQFEISIPNVLHLNGGVTDYYNPYKNTIITSDEPAHVPLEQIHVPFILTQSGLKPLTSVDMSRRYVKLHDEYKACDCIAAVGFGFNIDDSHINGLFRELVESHGKHLFWICLDSEGSSEQQQRTLVKKLRIAATYRDFIHAIPVSSNNRYYGNLLWLEAIKHQIN
jgi:hypothetical protein